MSVVLFGTSFSGCGVVAGLVQQVAAGGDPLLRCGYRPRRRDVGVILWGAVAVEIAVRGKSARVDLLAFDRGLASVSCGQVAVLLGVVAVAGRMLTVLG